MQDGLTHVSRQDVSIASPQVDMVSRVSVEFEKEELSKLERHRGALDRQLQSLDQVEDGARCVALQAFAVICRL